MVRTYCDMCERDTTETIDDLFGSRKFIMLDANDGKKMKEITLCAECKKTFYYIMENPEILQTQVHKMKLRNRIRYLFKCGVEEE